jgi:hypothetical protein
MNAPIEKNPKATIALSIPKGINIFPWYMIYPVIRQRIEKAKELDLLRKKYLKI